MGGIVKSVCLEMELRGQDYTFLEMHPNGAMRSFVYNLLRCIAAGSLVSRQISRPLAVGALVFPFTFSL